MDNPENWQHRVHKTKENKDNPEKLVTKGTQDTEQINVREY